METKTCKACHIEKPLTDYYKSKTCKDGRFGVCKVCRNNKKKVVYKREIEVELDRNLFRLYRCTKKDYEGMYAALKLLGYDIENGDIHQQFIDKWSKETGKNIKYKERLPYNQNAYLPDGTVNPLDRKNANNRKYLDRKKNPTD
jgi:hypothetical protein